MDFKHDNGPDEILAEPDFIDRVPVKFTRSNHSKCFFDPHKSCGSHSRSKLAYKRKSLLKQAKICGVPGADKLSLDALCLLMKDLYFEQQKKIRFIQRFEIFDDNEQDPNRYLVIPTELGGNLTITNARALKENKETLIKIQKILSNNHDKFDLRKLEIFGHIFFPQIYPIVHLSETDQQNLNIFLQRL